MIRANNLERSEFGILDVFFWAKTGFSKNVVIRPHKNSRTSGLVFLKAESTPLQAMQGGILVVEIFIVNGGDEVGILEKVEN